MIPRPSLRRTLVMSLVLHVVVAAVARWAIVPSREVARTELVDIEVAPPPPRPEALPEELARPPQEDLAAQKPEPAPESTPPGEPGEASLDAGIDAPPDAALDAPIDARPARRDAAIDAPADAAIDAGVDDAGATDDAVPGDAGPEPDALTVEAAGEHGDAGPAPDSLTVAAAGEPGDGGAAPAGSDAGPGGGSAVQVTVEDAGAPVAVAAGSGAGGGSGAAVGAAPIDTAALAAALSAGTAIPGATHEPAVEGAPTTAGTAANLLAYLPAGHMVTALIRFDRLRGTEWAERTERLLRPMPDYQLLFGAHKADVIGKLDTLVISTPRPRDVTATTLVGRTSLSRGALRDLLGAASPVTWSGSKGGLLGKRTGRVPQGDQRLFLSPFKGWFLLAQPGDLGALTGPAKGNLDAIEATAKLPGWLAGIRTIETESGDPRGPALVVTLGFRDRRVELGSVDFGLGIRSIPKPERVSIAMELVPQGWLVRGNLRFASEADAAEAVASVQKMQQLVANSRAIQLVISRPVARVVANLAFAQAGARVSYATSVSIADARAILAFAAQQLDQYFGRAP